jgi:hypothetical protein
MLYDQSTFACHMPQMGHILHEYSGWSVGWVETGHLVTSFSVKAARQMLFKALRTMLVSILVFAWVFSGWPQMFSFPSRIPELNAADGVAFVQSGFGDTVAGSSCTADFPSYNAAGNLIVVYTDFSPSFTISSVTDTAGNSYLPATTRTHDVNAAAQIWYAKNIKPIGTNTVRVNYSGAISFCDVYIHEYSGIDRSSPLDAVSSATGTSTTASSGAATVHYSGELVFGGGSNDTGSMSPIASFVMRRVDNDNISEDETSTTTGSYVANATVPAAAKWHMHMATFRLPMRRETR